jgi:hypothetical protein
MSTQTNIQTASGPAVACTDLLGHVITEKDMERTKEDMGERATREMLMIAALCRVLANSTKEHADDLTADGFELRAEEAQQRADDYVSTYWAICAEWPNEQVSDGGGRKVVGLADAHRPPPIARPKSSAMQSLAVPLFAALTMRLGQSWWSRLPALP